MTDKLTIYTEANPLRAEKNQTHDQAQSLPANSSAAHSEENCKSHIKPATVEPFWSNAHASEEYRNTLAQPISPSDQQLRLPTMSRVTKLAETTEEKGRRILASELNALIMSTRARLVTLIYKADCANISDTQFAESIVSSFNTLSTMGSDLLTHLEKSNTSEIGTID